MSPVCHLLTNGAFYFKLPLICTFTKRVVMKHWMLTLIVLILSPPDLFGQQDVLSPFRVEGPRISRTAFTNWDKIELVYTLGYYDGYEPMYEDLRPDNMHFSPLEMDP